MLTNQMQGGVILRKDREKDMQYMMKFKLQ